MKLATRLYHVPRHRPALPSPTAGIVSYGTVTGLVLYSISTRRPAYLISHWPIPPSFFSVISTEYRRCLGYQHLGTLRSRLIFLGNYGHGPFTVACRTCVEQDPGPTTEYRRVPETWRPGNICRLRSRPPLVSIRLIPTWNPGCICTQARWEMIGIPFILLLSPSRQKA